MYNDDPNYDPRYDSGDGGTPPPNPDRFVAGPEATNVSAIQQYYQQYLGRPASLDDVNSWLSNPGGLSAIEQGIKGSPEAQAYASRTATGPEAPPTPPPPGGAPPPAGTPPPTTTPPPTGPRLDDPFPGVFKPPPTVAPPTLPTFTPPTFGQPPAFSFRDFKAPSVEDALNSPGYKFRVGQGEQGLQNWAAARGTLNDSSTAKSLIDYGQNAGSQEYQNVWNRDFNEWGADLAKEQATYTTNYGSQYLDPYKFNYTGWQDSVLNPTLHNFDTQFQDVQHKNDNNYANAWNGFLQDWNQWKDQRDSTFDKRYKVAAS